jgi:hypothetical protein
MPLSASAIQLDDVEDAAAAVVASREARGVVGTDR